MACQETYFSRRPSGIWPEYSFNLVSLDATATNHPLPTTRYQPPATNQPQPHVRGRAMTHRDSASAHQTWVNERCRGKYGPHVTPRATHVAQQYGGWEALSGPAASASHIVFSNGEFDPWRAAGVNGLNVTERDVVSVLVQEGAHHLDLMFATPEDSQSVRDVRALEMAYITKWEQEAKAMAVAEAGAAGKVDVKSRDTKTCTSPEDCCYYTSTSSQYSQGTCSQTSDLDTCELFGDTYTAGDCEHTAGYIHKCEGRYSITFWYKDEDCAVCTTPADDGDGEPC